MPSKFKKALQSSFQKVGDRTLEKRYAAKTLKGMPGQEFDDRLLALYRQGYLGRQIASLLNMELSDVNKQLRELPPVRIVRL
jgi:Fic family protein